MTQDSQPQKPAWFQLADSDAPSAHVTKVNKKLPAIAALVTGAVIATGAFFASASENSQGNQQIASTSFNQVDTSIAATNSAAVATSNSSLTTKTNGVTSPGAASVQDPTKGGIQAPTAQSDDDGYERSEHDGGGHDDDGYEED